MDSSKILKKAVDEVAENFGQALSERNAEILKKAQAAGERGEISLHDMLKLEGYVRKGKKIPADFLRSIGVDVPGEPTRREALNEMVKALDRGEISQREFSIGEDELNRGVETPQTILKALESRRAEIAEDERFQKSLKKQKQIRVTPEVDVSTNFDRFFRSGQPLAGGKRNFVNSFLPPHLRT